MTADWIDITIPIVKGMEHWPGDPDVLVERFSEIGPYADYNATQFSMSAHTGTHVDAPLHFIAGGRSIDEMPVTQLIGTARVIAASELESVEFERGERILIRTDRRDGGISVTAADRLAECAAACVGIDQLSIGAADVHQCVLKSGVWIIEGLRLSQVEPGHYELICLPLRLAGADGAPARAVVRRLD